MQSKAKTVSEYIASLPEDRKMIISDIRQVIKKNLPKGFEETMQYGMISYVVPHKLYPAGYHCKPADALPFISIASQKKSYRTLSHDGVSGRIARLVPECLEGNH